MKKLFLLAILIFTNGLSALCHTYTVSSKSKDELDGLLSEYELADTDFGYQPSGRVGYHWARINIYADSKKEADDLLKERLKGTGIWVEFIKSME